MNISLRRFRGSDGERFSVLVDALGMPLYYPTLFSTWVLRNGSLAANSITNALNALKALCAWETHVGIDLELTFSQGVLLDENQIRDLSDFLKCSLVSDVGKKVVSINRKPKVVGASAHYFRMTVAADYVEFLANRVAKGVAAVHVQKMVSTIKANRPIKPSKSVPDVDEVHLPDEVLQTLEDALMPGAENNPARDYGVQLRNALMFTILRLTGMRRGELLNLKIEDIDFGDNTLRIVRRPDAKGDTRRHQPTSKTLPRRMAILPELIEKIRVYVMTERNKVPGARKHGYLFVTHKAGPTQGAALSISAFGKLMGELAEVVAGAGFHAHALRHNWNYRFSLLVDAQGMTPEQEHKTRSYLMGWSETSDSAGTYNRRHIKGKAQESVLELQKKYSQKPERNK
ncbi:site-specific integrase [Pseudomonas aeruginosa]|nr:site-specific integrase [Pseudomonas aeruginosa]MDI3829410.1 site-specific integrase [Pseudomonas aeruginosa]MDU0686171.1 site-specific integrase [Pseudomonas aeruginosa]HBN9565052.1 site-specific integrase [Pseudomonas aeruginosa]HBO3132182.1 site-specific integrase [Pseudomonas aeruginosa]